MNDDRPAVVEPACAELAGAGLPVTFVTVSERSGVPRITLYRNPTLRALVEEHRARSRDTHTLSGLAGEVVGLRLAVEALADRVRRQEELLRKLSSRQETKSG